jgi:hypothetical protein
MRHMRPHDVAKDMAPRGAPRKTARRRPRASRERPGRLEAVGLGIVAAPVADEEPEDGSSDIAGPELLDAAFDELGDLAFIRGDLSDRVRLHISANRRHDPEDLW